MSQRNPLPDAFRILGVFAVICIHTQPFLGPADSNNPDQILYRLGIFIHQCARFAIPMFLVFSGFFFGKKLLLSTRGPLAEGLAYAGRALAVWFFWCVVYLLANNWGDTSAMHANLNHVLTNAWMEGTQVHLWYLPSLAFGILLLSLLLQCRLKPRYLVIVGCVLYFIALLGGAYRETPLGIHLPFNTRDFMFFSTVFLAIGLALSQHALPKSSRLALILIGIGLPLHLLEGYLLHTLWNSPPVGQDFVLGTAPFAIGMAMLPFSTPDTTHPAILWMARIGRYSLGVYMMHYFLIELIRPFGKNVPHAAWEIALPMIVMALSLALSRLIARTFLDRTVL